MNFENDSFLREIVPHAVESARPGRGSRCCIPFCCGFLTGPGMPRGSDPPRPEGRETCSPIQSNEHSSRGSERLGRRSVGDRSRRFAMSRTATVDASIGRKVSLQVSPREGPECGPKPTFHRKCEICFTALTRSSADSRMRPSRSRQPRAEQITTRIAGLASDALPLRH